MPVSLLDASAAVELPSLVVVVVAAVEPPLDDASTVSALLVEPSVVALVLVAPVVGPVVALLDPSPDSADPSSLHEAQASIAERIAARRVIGLPRESTFSP